VDGGLQGGRVIVGKGIDEARHDQGSVSAPGIPVCWS
jgi:hypothetical protein